MNHSDLQALGHFLDRAKVRPMSHIHDGRATLHTIGMRHDCDNVIEPAVEMARWEYEHGICSTYYILHTSPYWDNKPVLQRALEAIAGYGHELGVHNDAITAQLETGRPAHVVLSEAVDELRGYGFTVRSTVAHGHRRCTTDRYVNDEMFVECHRPDYGDAERLGVETYPLASFGLEFDANWLPRGDYLSDSGGQWSQPFMEVVDSWPGRGQLHCLIHPDWWRDAFKVAA
jgi:hypothetical protein